MSNQFKDKNLNTEITDFTTVKHIILITHNPPPPAKNPTAVLECDLYETGNVSKSRVLMILVKENECKGLRCVYLCEWSMT